MPFNPSRHRRVSLQTKQCGAFILAGGKGSRLAPLTDSRAKPAVPFGGKYRLIDFTLSNCMNSGIRTVGLVTQYLPRELIDHCHLTWGWTRRTFGDLVIPMPAYQGPEGEGWYKGTADAIYQNLDFVEESDFQYLMVLSGDHIYKMDYGEMLSAHIESQADISIAVLGVPIEDANRFGVVQMDNESRITSFLEKPDNPPPDPDNPSQALSSMGVYIFSRDLLVQLLKRDHERTDSSNDFGKDIIPKACEVLNVFGYRFENTQTGVQRYWRDVGTLDAYFDANMDLISIDPDLDLYDDFWPIWAFQEPAPGVKFVFNDEVNGRGEAHESVLSAGSVITGYVNQSLLFTSVRVRKKASVERSLLLHHCTVGRNCQIRNAIVDEGCNIPDHMQIGVDIEQDRERFLVTESGLVVVTPAMLDALT